MVSNRYLSAIVIMTFCYQNLQAAMAFDRSVTECKVITMQTMNPQVRCQHMCPEVSSKSFLFYGIPNTSDNAQKGLTNDSSTCALVPTYAFTGKSRPLYFHAIPDVNNYHPLHQVSPYLYVSIFPNGDSCNVMLPVHSLRELQPTSQKHSHEGN